MIRRLLLCRSVLGGAPVGVLIDGRGRCGGVILGRLDEVAFCDGVQVVGHAPGVAALVPVVAVRHTQKRIVACVAVEAAFSVGGRRDVVGIGVGLVELVVGGVSVFICTFMVI